MLLDIILAALILVNLLLGLKRGLLVMLGKLVLLVLIVAIVAVAAGPLTDFLAKVPFLAPISDRISAAVLDPLTESAVNIGTAIESLGIPKLIGDLLQSQLPTADNTVTQAFPEFSAALFKFFLNAVIYILMFIIVVLVVSLLTRALTRAADRVPVVGGVNRLGGMLLGLAIGLAEAVIILLVLGFLSPIWDTSAGWLKDSWLAARFYEIDLLALIF